MNTGRRCFNSESYNFAMRHIINRTVKEEKLKIAKSLIEKTDLSLSQIADIVGLKKDELEKAFRHIQRDSRTVKYHLQPKTSKEEQLFKDLDSNLLAIKKKQEEFKRKQ